MSCHAFAAKSFCRLIAASAILFACVLMPSASINGQTTTDTNVIANRAVGGVSIDTDGILRSATRDDLGVLGKLRGQAAAKIPAALNGPAPMREISLRRLEDAMNKCVKDGQPLPDEIKYLAGLQQIRYVFVYPEKKDIVLVGPGEGWKLDASGNVVGITTGRPVMLLDDLLVALRTAKGAAQGGITCSINPTKEGIAREMQELPGLTRTGNVQTVATGLEKALGMQRITLHGVPETSHFARVLVAADYRLKRLGMALDPSPVRGLPSYLEMVRPSSRAVLSPRFWLEPTFEALLRDNDGLAFELCGSSVKAMTEEDFNAAGGGVRHSGKASPLAQRWANRMTEKYPELAIADPIFGQLQNCMELAVVGALIVKEHLPEKAGYDMPMLLDSSALKADVFNSPKEVPTIASIRGRAIGASGGVAINSWAIVDKLKPSDDVARARAKATFAETADWWRN